MTTLETGVATQTVAFMDIGTNSIRLLVVEITRNHSYTVLHQLKETVRLGEGEFLHQHLQAEAIDRAVFVARYFAQFAHRAGAREIIAVATAATREAENQHTLLRRMRNEAGVDVHLVSGLEEARLIYLGVVNGIHLEDKQALFIDIGGGSTELVIGTQTRHLYLNSLKLGAIRLTTRFLADQDGPVPEGLYQDICDYVRNTAARSLHELRAFEIDLAVGSSGTIENLAEIGARMFFKRPWERDDALSAGHLRQVVSYLCSLSVEERRKVPGMNSTRADIIIGGAAILETLAGELGLPEIRVSDRGLREGLLVDYLTRQGQTALVEEGSVRERSVLQLGRTCRFNEAHARKTASLALSLFDSTRELALHGLGRRERDLLEYAALLHHIGAFLTYSNYQKHSAYLIRNAELLGFDQTETSIIADTVLYHRNALPHKKHPGFAGLSPAAQRTVRVLAMLLRLAENLDRSQTGAIEEARVGLRGQDAVLRIDASQDYQVELWGLKNQVAGFERVFGRRLEIVDGDTDVGKRQIA